MNGKANPEKVRAGLLGVGLMGTAMAHRLLDQGLAVVAWDRNPSTFALSKLVVRS